MEIKVSFILATFKVYGGGSKFLGEIYGRVWERDGEEKMADTSENERSIIRQLKKQGILQKGISYYVEFGEKRNTIYRSSWRGEFYSIKQVTQEV